MTNPGEHLTEETLSVLIDGRLTPGELVLAQSHLGTCAQCQARRDELITVVALLQALPAIDQPRSFELGPRLVADPPNVIRLRRWYTVARAGAATLAAAFVFLSVGALYVDSRPAASPQTLTARSQPAPAANDAAASPPTAAAAVPRAAAPAAPPAAAGAAVVRSQAQPSPTAEASDQTAAATSIRPLPTLAPTAAPPAPTAVPFAAQQSPAPEPFDSAARLRVAAALVGVLAVVSVFTAFIVRHRLAAVSNLPTE